MSSAGIDDDRSIVAGKNSEEVSGEGVDVFWSVCSSDGDAEACGALGNRGGPDGVHMPAMCQKSVCDGDDDVVVAEEKGENGGMWVRDVEVLGQAADIGPQARATRVAVGAGDDVDGGGESGEEGGGDAGCEHEASSSGTDPVAQSMAAGEKGPCAAECLAEGSDERGWLDAIVCGVAYTAGEEAKSVGLVEIEAAVVFEMRSQELGVDGVSIHGKDGLAYPPCEGAGDSGWDGRGVTVWEDEAARACEAKTVDETGVVEDVAEDKVGCFEKGGQNADVELKATGKEDGVGGSDEACEAAFDLTVLGEVAADQSRGAGTRRDGRVGAQGEYCVGEIEIVVAAEADTGTVVDAVGNAMSMGDRGETPCHAGAVEREQARF